jgi:hypothetical protein
MSEDQTPRLHRCANFKTRNVNVNVLSMFSLNEDNCLLDRSQASPSLPSDKTTTMNVEQRQNNLAEQNGSTLETPVTAPL